MFACSRYTRRRGIPLALCIILIVVGTVTLMSVLNLLYIYNASDDVSENYASESFEMISRAAKIEINDNIDPIIATLRTISIFPHVREPGSLRWERAKENFLRSALQTLNAHPNILAVNYGYADGSFFSVTALRDNAVRQAYKAPQAAVYALWGVGRNGDEDIKEFWEFLDGTFQSLHSFHQHPSYDPRERSWYKQAMQSGKLTMTQPYIFNTSREMGVAAAVPLQYETGVFSVNIMLKNFDGLLRGISLSPQSHLFILDSENRILGERTPGNRFTKVDRREQGHALLPLAQHPDPLIQAMAAPLAQCTGSTLLWRVDLRGEEYFLSCASIPMGTQTITLAMLSPLVDFTGLVQAFFGNTLVFAVITMLIFIPLATWVAWKVGRSLTDLLRETLRVKQFRWDGGAPVASRILEIRRLSQAITSMKKSIRKRTEALKDAQSGLENTVRQRTAELRSALDMAEEATEAKSRFLSTVSHEIRTPMNAIVGFSYLFERKNLSVKQLDYLEKIRISSETLLRIINDVLDFSKIEAGRLDIETIPFHLQTVLDTVESIARFPAREKYLHFAVQQDKDVPLELLGDPTRLHQILLNLVSNAIKFTAQGSVVLRVSCDPTHQATDGQEVALLFTVEDTGIGISPEQLQRLFTPFVQGDSSTNRKYGGTGLGLVICKQLAELMQGSISVQSQWGQGSAFAARLIFNRLEPGQYLPEESPTLQGKQWRRGCHLLVVDDNVINREIAGALLADTGAVVDFAENGEDAVHKVQHHAYDLVFMDMQMPVMDGLEATKAIRALHRDAPTPTGQVPIVAMTANAMLEDRYRCLEAGMNDHIAKPLLPDALLALLARWLPAADPEA